MAAHRSVPDVQAPWNCWQRLCCSPLTLSAKCVSEGTFVEERHFAFCQGSLLENGFSTPSKQSCLNESKLERKGKTEVDGEVQALRALKTLAICTAAGKQRMLDKGCLTSITDAMAARRSDGDVQVLSKIDTARASTLQEAVRKIILGSGQNMEQHKSCDLPTGMHDHLAMGCNMF
eukprot:5705784-Amphidinium_carterae.1